MYKSTVHGKGGIYAKVVCDSIQNGIRLTTFELRYPRFILAELNTHRVFSRNSSSSRAIPVKRTIEQVTTDPAMPIHWGKNQPGMQAAEESDAKLIWTELHDDGYNLKDFSHTPKEMWQLAAKDAAHKAEVFSEGGYHKQIVNRLLEPFQFMKTVLTATEWENFFHLRDHKDAQPEIEELARCMKIALAKSNPHILPVGAWHTPYVKFGGVFTMSSYVTREELIQDMLKASAARCARVSYLNHDNSSPSLKEDLKLYSMLAVRPYDDGKGHVLAEDDPVHLSPLEHQATPMLFSRHTTQANWEKGITHQDRQEFLWSANFRSWIQYRQLI